MSSSPTAAAARVYPNRRFSVALAALLALLPFACLVRMCIRLHVDVPFWDEWGLVTRLDHLYSGTLTFADFWGQHNEHRVLVPMAVMVALARLSRWNIGWEVAVNVALGAGIFGVFSAYLFTAWRDRGGAPVWLLPVVSVLVFSPVQWENWLWGWQMTVMMCALASVLGAYLIASGAQRRGRFAGALACGVWATYSFASGLVYWVAQPAGLWAGGGRRRRVRLAVWLVVAAATCASYFYDYHRPGPQPTLMSNFASLDAFRRFVLYVLTYIGAPIAWSSQPHAAGAGAVVVVTFSALAARLWRLRAEPVFLFPFLVGLQTTGTAVVSGLGRAWIGVPQALSSRYTTFTVPLWCATACLLVLWRSTWNPGWARRAATLVTASLIAAMLYGAVTSGRAGLHQAAGRSMSLRFARRGLITGSDAHLRTLLPILDVIRDRRAVLLRLRLSVFRPSARPTYPVPGPP